MADKYFYYKDQQLVIPEEQADQVISDQLKQGRILTPATRYIVEDQNFLIPQGKDETFLKRMEGLGKTPETFDTFVSSRLAQRRQEIEDRTPLLPEGKGFTALETLKNAPKTLLNIVKGLPNMAPVQLPPQAATEIPAAQKTVSDIPIPQPEPQQPVQSFTPSFAGPGAPPPAFFRGEAPKPELELSPIGEKAGEAIQTVFGRPLLRGIQQARLAGEFDEKQLNPEQIAEIQRELADLPESEASRKFNEADTFKGSLKELAKAPHIILPELIVQSSAAFLPQLIKKAPARVAIGAAAGAAAGAPISGIGAVPGAGIGATAGLMETIGNNSLLLESSGHIMDSLSELGVNIQDADSLEAAFSDKDLMKRLKQNALIKGVPIAVLDALSVGIAGKLFKAPAKKVVGKALQFGGELAVQSALGGGGEALGQVAAGEEIQPSAILGEAIAEIGSGTAEVVTGRALQTQPTETTPLSPVQAEPIQTPTPEPVVAPEVAEAAPSVPEEVGVPIETPTNVAPLRDKDRKAINDAWDTVKAKVPVLSSKVKGISIQAVPRSTVTLNSDGTWTIELSNQETNMGKKRLTEVFTHELIHSFQNRRQRDVATLGNEETELIADRIAKGFADKAEAPVVEEEQISLQAEPEEAITPEPTPEKVSPLEVKEPTATTGAVRDSDAIPPKSVAAKAKKTVAEAQMGETRPELVQPAPETAKKKKAPATPLKPEEVTTAFKNANLKALRVIHNLPEGNVKVNKKTEDLMNDAIADGTFDRAESIAEEINQGLKTVSTDKEQLAMGLKVMEVTENIKELQAKKDSLNEETQSSSIDSINDEIDAQRERMSNLVSAGESTGTELSSSFRVRQFVNKIATDEIEAIRSRTKAAIKGDPTVKQKRELGLIDSLTKKLEKSNDQTRRLQDRVRKLEEGKIKGEAKRGLVVEVRKIGRKVNKDKAKKVRTKALTELKKVAFKTTELREGITSILAKSVTVPAEAVVPITNLIRSYVMEGVVEVDQIVDRVQADVPEIGKFDVYDILASRVEGVKKKAKSNVVKTMGVFRKQARIMSNISDVFTGRQRKGKKKVKTTRPKLRKMLDDFSKVSALTTADLTTLELVQKRMDVARDMLEEAMGLNNTLPDDAQVQEAGVIINDAFKHLKVEEKISEMEAALKDPEKLAELAIEAPRQKAFLSDELRRAQARSANLRAEINSRVKDLKGLSFGERYVKYNRTLMGLKFGLEWSFIMRQGGKLAPLMPKRRVQALRIARASTASPETARMMDMSMRADPAYRSAVDEAGIDFSELGSSPTKGEEIVISDSIERIPVLGKFYASMERGNVNALNFLRLQRYKDVLKANPNMTQEEKVAVGKVINDFGGRGNLKGKAKIGADLAGAFITAPRYLVAEISVGTGVTFMNAMRQPASRKLAAGSFARNITSGLGMMFFATMLGADVGWDIDDSDFGKIIMGKRRFNVWGPTQGIVRLALLLAVSAGEAAGLTEKKLKKQITGKDAFGRLLRYRIAPLPQAISTIAFRKDFIGRELTLPEAVYEATFNAFLGNVVEAFREEGLSSAAQVGLTEFVGFSSSIQGGFRHQIPKRILARANNYKPSAPGLVSKGRERKEDSMQLPRWVAEEPRFRRDIKEAWENGLSRRIIAAEEDLKKMDSKQIRKEILGWSQEIKRSIAEGIPNDKPSDWKRGREAGKLEKQFPSK